MAIYTCCGKPGELAGQTGLRFWRKYDWRVLVKAVVFNLLAGLSEVRLGQGGAVSDLQVRCDTDRFHPLVKEDHAVVSLFFDGDRGNSVFGTN